MYESTLQSAQHPQTKDHQMRGSSMQCIHYLQVIAFAGATVKNALIFLCSLYTSKYLHRMRNCLRVLNHLGYGRKPSILYASAAAWNLAWFGSVCNWKPLAFVLLFYSDQPSLIWTSVECWWPAVMPESADEGENLHTGTKRQELRLVLCTNLKFLFHYEGHFFLIILQGFLYFWSDTPTKIHGDQQIRSAGIQLATVFSFHRWNKDTKCCCYHVELFLW